MTIRLNARLTANRELLSPNSRPTEVVTACTAYLGSTDQPKWLCFMPHMNSITQLDMLGQGDFISMLHEVRLWVPSEPNFVIAE